MPTKVTVGEMLSLSIAAFLRGLGPILVLVILIYGVIFGAAYLGGLSQTAAPSFGASLLVFLCSFFAAFLAQGAIIRGTYGILRGEPFNLQLSLAVAMRRVLPLTLLALAMTVMLVAGYMLLVIPGIMLQCALFVAVPVLMVERGNVAHAIQRSFALTAGYRLRIFGLYIMIQIVVGLPLGILSMILQMALVDTSPQLVAVLTTLINGLSGMAGAVAMVVAYYKLREEVDGVGLDDLADVFA